MSTAPTPRSAGAGQSSAKVSSLLRFKTATHTLAAAMFTGFLWLSHFATSPAGQALTRQYPKLSIAASVITAASAAAALYFSPKSQ